MTIRVCRVKGTWGMGILMNAPTAVRAAKRETKTMSVALFNIRLSYSTFSFSVKSSGGLANPRFLRKEPFVGKTPGGGKESPWGSGWRNSDHHPEAVILPSERAFPEEIRKMRRFRTLFPLGMVARRPLFEEDRRKGD
jgi:hypothetical protein